ncbi:hypothetical protein ACE1BS_22060, partial [Aeromonas jandaei]
VNTSEFWSNENFKREQAGYDEGAIHLFAPSLCQFSVVGVTILLVIPVNNPKVTSCYINFMFCFFWISLV